MNPRVANVFVQLSTSKIADALSPLAARMNDLERQFAGLAAATDALAPAKDAPAAMATAHHSFQALLDTRLRAAEERLNSRMEEIASECRAAPWCDRPNRRGLSFRPHCARTCSVNSLTPTLRGSYKPAGTSRNTKTGRTHASRPTWRCARYHAFGAERARACEAAGT